MRITFTLLLSGIFLITACTFTQKIKDGPTAFERKQYKLAVDLFEKEFEKEKSRVEKGKIAYQIGASYQAMNQTPKAIDWYQTAYDYQYGVEALREYAFALKGRPTVQGSDERLSRNWALRSVVRMNIEKKFPLVRLPWVGWRPQQRITGSPPMEFNTNKADYAPVLYENNQLGLYL